MLKRNMIGECKVCVRALSIKCSHRRAGEGLLSNVKITHGDLLSLYVCVRASAQLLFVCVCVCIGRVRVHVCVSLCFVCVVSCIP